GVGRARAATAQNGPLIAAIAASEGVAAALREAGSRLAGNEQRAEILRQAAFDLLRLRRYPESAALFEEAAREHANGAALHLFAERVRRPRRHGTVKFDLPQPGGVARAAVHEGGKARGDNQPPPKTVLSRLVTPEVAEDLWGQETSVAIRHLMRVLARSSGGVPVVTMADIFAGSELDMNVDGRPGIGYRVRITGAE